VNMTPGLSLSVETIRMTLDMRSDSLDWLILSQVKGARTELNQGMDKIRSKVIGNSRNGAYSHQDD
jgi:hypothetical protein